MKSKVTPLFSKFIADDVKNHFAEESNTYLGIGRSLSFGDSAANVEELTFTTNKVNEFYRNMVAMKKIEAADMQVVAARVDWSANAKYDTYEDDVELFAYEDFTDVGTANANVNSIIPGTVTIPSVVAQPAIVGSGTEFTKYLFVGDDVSVNSEVRKVLLINSDTSILVNANFTYVAAGKQLSIIANNRTLVANSANFVGNVFSGNTILVGSDLREVVTVRSDKVIAVNSNLTIGLSNTTLLRVDNTYPVYANSFYVRNSRDQVFKCLFNNSKANSTVEPTIDIDGQLPENPFIQTGDGYKWKYLYTIPPGLKQKFFNESWMPVANDNSVVAASTIGRLDIINVLWGGSGHLGGGNSNTARILSVTNTDGANANLIARVSNGVIQGVTIINGGNNYTLGTITITDTDKLGNTTLAGTINVSGTTVSGNLSNTTYFLGNVFTNDILTVNNESRNVVTVVDNTTLTVNTAFTYGANTVIGTVRRSNAVFDIEFAPHEGHGHYPAEELGAHSLMITVELDGDENSTLPVTDVTNTFDFNQISIVSNPTIANGAYIANAANYRIATRVLVSDPGISNFVNDETVYVGSSLSSANMVANVAHWDSEDNFLYINNITGNFSASELIRGNTSGVVAPVLEISNSQIKLYSGDVLYTENRQNVVRDEDQIEQVKVVLIF